MPSAPLQKALFVAIQAAQEAGEIIVQGSRKAFSVSRKPDMTVLTEIDLGAEAKILDLISDEFPSHSIISEETGQILKDSEYAWIIDPLCGSRNFSRHIPIVGVSIALMKEKQIEVAVIYQPFTDELFVAERGKGTTLNGKRVRVSEIKDLSDAHGQISGLTGARFNKRRVRTYNQLASLVDAIRTIGSAATSLAYLATGRYDFCIDYQLKFCDIASGILLIEEAGGIITSIDGQPINIDSERFDVLATNGSIHEGLLNIIK